MKRINHKLQTVISHMQNVQSWFDGARTDTSVKLAAATDEKALVKYQERAAYIDGSVQGSGRSHCAARGTCLNVVNLFFRP